jgi:hypothetical protein
MTKHKSDLLRLNRFTLARHCLLEQARPADLVTVVSQVCGLNAQTARGPYLSLLSRLKGFKRRHLDKALYEDRLLIKTWLMRGTVHMVPSDEFVAYQVALRKHLSKYWDRFLKRFGSRSLTRNSSRLFESLLDEICKVPRTKKELLPRVGYLLRSHSEREKKTIVSCALRQMSYQGFVCHAEPTGTWYHFKDNRFTTVLNWIPEGILAKISEDEARSRLFLAYLKGYGPATLQDFAYWSGFKMPQVREIFDGARDSIHQVKIAGARGDYWLRKEDADAFERARVRSKAPVRFLPEFDSLIMGHKDKVRIIDPKDRAGIFLRFADVAPVVMVDGRAVGTWSYGFTDRSMTVSLFDKMPASVDRQVELTSKGLTDFLEV